LKEVNHQTVCLIRIQIRTFNQGQAGNVNVEFVQALLQKYALLIANGSNLNEIRPYLFWSDVHYTRNLVFACDDFELMVLCWGVGHGSRIHNHGSSHCFMAALSGTVSEQRYMPLLGAAPSLQVVSPTVVSLDHPVPPPPTTSTTISTTTTPVSTVEKPLLFLLGETTLHAGQVAYINDKIALHRVANFHTSANAPDRAASPLTQFGSVTLHLYAPPVRRVSIFEPGQATYVRTPGFFSINAVKN
jgi:cysteine dioxygenase